MAMTQEKKKLNRHEGKLAIRDANLFKAQQKKKLISNTEKASLFNQMASITNGDEKFNLYCGCQQKKKKKKKLHQICNGVSNNTTTEHMDMDIVYPQAMGIQCDDEITMEIFKRLPVQSSLRFKCVLKSWKTLISDPYFKM